MASLLSLKLYQGIVGIIVYLLLKVSYHKIVLNRGNSVDVNIHLCMFICIAYHVAMIVY